MIANLYAIKDELSEFSPGLVPFEEEGQARRWFREKIKETPIMANNPEDFSLWDCARFDTKTGKISIGNNGEPTLVERAKGAKIGNEE